MRVRAQAANIAPSAAAIWILKTKMEEIFRSMSTIKNLPQNPIKKQRKIKWEKFQTRHGNPHMSSRMTIRDTKSTGKSLDKQNASKIGSKQKYKVKDSGKTYVSPIESSIATMDVIDSVNRMNNAAARMISSKNLGTAKTILIGAERMTHSMAPGALTAEFNECRAITLMRLGLIMNREKDYEGGLTYLQEALKLDRLQQL